MSLRPPRPQRQGPVNSIHGTGAHLCTVPSAVVRPHKETLLLGGVRAGELGWAGVWDVGLGQPLRAFLSGQGELKQRPQPQMRVRTQGHKAGHRRIGQSLGGSQSTGDLGCSLVGELVKLRGAGGDLDRLCGSWAWAGWGALPSEPAPATVLTECHTGSLLCQSHRSNPWPPPSPSCLRPTPIPPALG